MKKTILTLTAGILLGAGGVFIWVIDRDARAAALADQESGRQSGEINKLRGELASARNSVATLRQQYADAGFNTDPAQEGVLDIQRLLNDARPLMKSLALMFGEQRKQMAERMIKGMAERLAEEMGLTAEQTADMIAHFMKLDDENFAKIKAMFDRQITMLDVFGIMKDMNPAKSMDDYVIAKLTDDQKKTWDTRKLESKAQQLERTANWQIQRMDKLNLDETQKDQVFDILVKKNPQYDASLAVEGLNAGSTFDASKSQEEAIAAVLREDQRADYQAMQERQNKDRQRWTDALGGFDPMQLMQGMGGMDMFGGGGFGRGGGGRGK